MDAAQEMTVDFCKCPHCNNYCTNDIRPYVCRCGAVLGKQGWLTKVIIKRTTNTVPEGRVKNTKEETGRKAWSKLHSEELGTPEFLKEWKTFMPSGCDCRKKTEAILKRLPPRYDSPQSWFEWSIEFHNEVNLSLEKPTITLDRAYMLWKNRRPQTGRARAVITVANGVEFSHILAMTRPFMQTYANRVNADLIDLDNDTESWGLMEKFRVYEFAKQYHEVMFVDADCIITEKCPDLFDFDGEVSIHNDYELFRSAATINEERKNVSQRSGVEIPSTKTAYNTGVVVTRGRANHIWVRPEVPIGNSRLAEQVWIESQINRNDLKVNELPHQANWQYWYGRHSQSITPFEDGIRDAWIVHASATTKKEQLIKKLVEHLSADGRQGRDRLASIKRYIESIENEGLAQDKDLVQHVITWDQFTQDTLTLSQIILDKHPDVSGIAGVPRSGMRAACDISMRLGVPLYEINANGLRYVGGGSRIRLPHIHGERIEQEGEIVVVDDSTCTGRAFEELKTKLPFYAVYGATPGKQKITGCAVELEWPHVFDWNVFNNGYIFKKFNVGIDFDGVLCEDCPVEDDDDGSRYREWMTTRKPIRSPRDYSVPFIITARREAYRDLTEEWLKRYRISYGQLVMYPGTFEERKRSCIGTWKAEQCRKFDIGWFIESSYEQARVMSQILQKPVISVEPKPKLSKNPKI